MCDLSNVKVVPSVTLEHKRYLTLLLLSALVTSVPSYDDNTDITIHLLLSNPVPALCELCQGW